MNLDDEVCLCFHVTKRKLVNYLKVEKPRRAGQLADCFGAGTGCGWCRGYLTRLFDRHRRLAAGGTADTLATDDMLDNLSAVEHARGRSRYVKAGGGTPPPGATPIED